MKKIIFILIIIILVGGAGFFIYHRSNKDEPLKIDPGKISGIESLAELCTVEFYNEVPVKDTVNNKAIFAIQKQQGYIAFDMENIATETRGDTLFITLPKEIIHLYESTNDNSYEVIDTKGLSFFTSSKLTNAEDNIVKSHIRDNSIRRLYSSGAVARARREGRGNIALLMSKIYRMPVVVTDPSPSGYPPK